jgi:hypothetical protein
MSDGIGSGDESRLATVSVGGSFALVLSRKNVDVAPACRRSGCAWPLSTARSNDPL